VRSGGDSRRLGIVPGLLLLAACAAAAGCTRSLADAACPCLAGWTCCASENRCVLEGTACPASDASADAPSCFLGGTNLCAGTDAPLEEYSCATMQRFTAAEQVIDGVGDEFADIVPVIFRASDAPWTDVVPPPDLPERVTFRAAWSPDAFHIHIHVDDPFLYINDDTTKIWDGDSVEVFVANSTTFSGRFDGVVDGGALHVGVVPPSVSSPAPRAVIYVDPPGTGYRYPLDARLYTARLVPGGYEAELILPWKPSTAPPVAGGSIGFQFAINAEDAPKPPGAQNGRQLTANLPMRAVDSPGCGLVWCDDRTWCRPTLE
jgi:hypothetical protein